MTASPSIAEDVTQDVFLAVMSDAALRCREGFGRRLALRIARNHRSPARRARPPARAAARRREDEGVERSWPSKRRARRPDEGGEHSGPARRGSSLPVRYREAVVVCDLEEMSYRDAAAALGCAVGTVRSRLHRGRALLAVKLPGAGLEPNEPGSARENRTGASTSSRATSRPPNQTLQSVRNLA